MADYGVPTDVDGALPWVWASERLERCRNFWIVTVDHAIAPHAMPVWGVWIDADERFFFSTSPNSLKARNIADNPRVVVAADDTVECVSMEGLATRLDAGPVADTYIARYVEKYEPDPVKAEAMVGFVGSHAMFIVRPVRAIGIIEREDEFAARATRWSWPHP